MTTRLPNLTTYRHTPPTPEKEGHARALLGICSLPREDTYSCYAYDRLFHLHTY